MYAAPLGAPPDLMDHAWAFAHVAGAALLAGWLAERTFDTGLRVRGIGPLAGVLGYWAGSGLWGWAGWSQGPVLGDVPIVPICAGTLAVCAMLKLIGLGAAGPRW
jgi:hypothetical protein